MSSEHPCIFRFALMHHLSCSKHRDSPHKQRLDSSRTHSRHYDAELTACLHFSTRLIPTTCTPPPRSRKGRMLFPLIRSRSASVVAHSIDTTCFVLPIALPTASTSRSLTSSTTARLHPDTRRRHNGTGNHAIATYITLCGVIGLAACRSHWHLLDTV